VDRPRKRYIFDRDGRRKEEKDSGRCRVLPFRQIFLDVYMLAFFILEK
jgi:hypothetical protein